MTEQSKSTNKQATKPDVHKTSSQIAKLAPNKPKNVRNYPIITVEKCLIIAQKIKEINGGNSWTSKEVRDAINIRDSNKFFYYSAASRDFGFTIGTRDSKEIVLTEFGRSTVYAPNPEIERKKKIEAFLNINIFKDVLEYYKGSTLPEMKYLSNTLEDKFKLSPEFHEEFSRVFGENCKELGITAGNPLDDLSTNSIDGRRSTLVVGEAKKHVKGNLKAFVIMPFVERNNNRPIGFFKEVLEAC